MPPTQITIRKTDLAGNIQATYPAWILQERDPLLVVARWRYESLPLSFVTFAHGDLLFECFPRRRYFNIFALCDGAAAPLNLDLAELAARFRRLDHVSSPPASFCALASVACPLKGHYVNFTLPVDYRPDQAILTWVDLALDMWAPVEGAPILLDEEEYAALNLADAHPSLHAAVQQTLAELWPHALAHSGPFDPARFCAALSL